MNAVAAADTLADRTGWLGRPFVNAPFDYLLIGGGLSLLALPFIVSYPPGVNGFTTGMLPALLLLTSSAHFAASTVRLYGKRGATESLPFLTMLLPLITIAVLALALMQPTSVGAWLQALYLTWSPFHYAAQAYGLAVMYCLRSGTTLSVREKQALWWVAMLPFARAFLGGTHSGLGWFVPRDVLMTVPLLPSAVQALTSLIAVLTFVVPVALVTERRKWGASKPLPLIVLTILLSNGVWWVVLDYLDAFVWATIFHGLQYLAIATIFYVRDQNELTAPGRVRRPLVHAAWFYAVSALLGYGLFYCWPYAFRLVGFGQAESMLLVIATINIHHFIVDRYIWRVGFVRKARLEAAAGPAGHVAAAVGV
jgi:hypothetical protein